MASQPHAKEPVVVRLYGLVRMTRRRYLTQLAVAAVCAVVLLALWWLRWPALRQSLLSPRNPLAEAERLIGDNFPWIVLAGAVVQAVEAVVVLRLFARKEAARGAGTASGEPGA